MGYPVINVLVYGDHSDPDLTKCDATLCTDITRATCSKLMPAKIKDGVLGSGCKSARRIYIWDRHDGENDPHFELDISSEHGVELDKASELVIYYCETSFEDCSFNQNPGRFGVSVGGDFDGHSHKDIQELGAQIYLWALKKNFPNITTVTDRPELEPKP